MKTNIEKLVFFLSESTEEALKNPNYDLINLQTGRFASYFTREIPMQGYNLSVYLNYTALPEGFLICAICFDTFFNSLLIGSDKDFLPVARRKYPTFNKGLSVFEKMKYSQPKNGEIWLGIDRDPNDGAEITIAAAIYPINANITKNADKLYDEIISNPVKDISTSLMDFGFEILNETSDPIDPIKDTLRHKKLEFFEDIQDPRKVTKAIAEVLWKQYGGDILHYTTNELFNHYSKEINNLLGDKLYTVLYNHLFNKKEMGAGKAIELIFTIIKNK